MKETRLKVFTHYVQLWSQLNVNAMLPYSETIAENDVHLSMFVKKNSRKDKLKGQILVLTATIAQISVSPTISIQCM